jgi:histidinol-phosphate phosphatase family protein
MRISKHFKITKDWTLFLDRDGVINVLRVNDYVKSLEEFIFNEGALEAIKILSSYFNRIIVVTNQQGVGKGLYTHETLAHIHDYMLQEVEKAGGKIDHVFYAPNLSSENSVMRKPEIGMAIEAKELFPEINFKKSLMIGDSKGDMQFADNIGMQKIKVYHDAPDDQFQGLQFESLMKIAIAF